jgi:hypothetical protein
MNTSELRNILGGLQPWDYRTFKLHEEISFSQRTNLYKFARQEGIKISVETEKLLAFTYVKVRRLPDVR